VITVNEELKRLGDEYWEYTLEVSPTQALMLGDHRYGDRHEEVSREAEDRHIARLRRFADAAEAIDPAGLTPDERISRDVLIFTARTEAAVDESRGSEWAVNPEIGFQAMLPVVMPNLPIQEPEHAEQLLDKVRGMARFVDEATERLGEGVASGRVPLASHARRVVERLDALDVEGAMLSVRVPAAFDESEAAAWKDRLGAVVRDEFAPALARHRAAVADAVAPAGRGDDQAGITNLPGGDEAYATAIHRHTSLDISAQQIHDTGLEQVKRLADEYRELGAEALGTSDLDEIFTRLRDDPDIHFSDGPSIVAASETAMARAKAEMGDWFGRLPVADCVVSETPSGPLAFYFRPAADGSRPGTFFVNTADPTRWGHYEIEAMAFHEGIPGHHLQLAISQELDGVPEFRRHAFITAYAEGWGLYTERLADEMGLYSGTLERIGMLSADSMRACRLVVDTGMHALGWSRQQAIDFMAGNSPMSIGAVENEIDRYIGMPGQAVSYMIGRLEIQRLRREAEEAMGDRFDIKGFHDVVLGSGLVPLPTLGRMVGEWAAA
jgi:uncharacterized protein (DUF885 family)